MNTDQSALGYVLFAPHASGITYLTNKAGEGDDDAINYSVFRATLISPNHTGLKGQKLEPFNPQPLTMNLVTP